LVDIKKKKYIEMHGQQNIKICEIGVQFWTVTSFLLLSSPQYSHIVNKLLTSNYFRGQNSRNTKQGSNSYLIQRSRMHGATPTIPDTPL